MLVGTRMEFRVVDAIDDYLSMEGTEISKTDAYTCTAVGEEFFVVFTSFTNNQILVIAPDWYKNLDPDGGTSFMCKEVVSLVEALTSEKSYI